MDKGIVEPKVRRRSEIDIIIEILSYLKRSPSIKNRIMYACNLSYNVLKKYLTKLVEGGYIAERPLTSKKGSFYAITPLGNQTLKRLQADTAFAQEVLGGV